jgi:hypothetical protein
MKPFPVIVLLAGMLGLGSHNTANAALAADGHIALAPASLHVLVGESFSVNIEGQDFMKSVQGGGLELFFSPAVLRVDRVSFDPIWNFETRVDTGRGEAGIDNVNGRIDAISFAAFPNGPTGNFRIATIDFTALAAGRSRIDLAADNFFAFSDDLGDPLSPTFASGEVDVTVVPVPAALWLMVAGLGVFGAGKRPARRAR